jgi:cobalamin biosynthesis protein CobT
LCGRQVSRIYTGEPQPRIFKERNSSRITTDIAVFILGDCSGSMSDMKYVTSAACQILLSETLRDLQVAHMCTQFTTDNYGLVHYITKHFDEPNVSRDTLLKRYTSGDIDMAANGDGESITWAATLLAKRPEKRKLLVVLSDGTPAFSYGDDYQYLVDVVKEIEKSRIMDIVGVGILTDAVQHFYKDNRVVNKVQDLERVIFELLKDTLKGGAR